MGSFDTKRFPIGKLESISPSEQTLNEPVHTVLDGKIKLSYIPDEVYRVYIAGYVENTYNTPITTATQFIVDYNNGIIYFDSSQEGVSITITEYWKQGRIIVDADNVEFLDGETIEEMQTRLDTHIDGTNYNHNTGAIDNVSSVSGTTQTEVNNNLKAEVDALVIGASNTTIGVFPITDNVNTNNYVGTFAGLTLFDRLRVDLKVTNTNTGASTLDINSIGAKSLKNRDGEEFSAGELVSGRVYQFAYDGADFINIQNDNEIGILSTLTTTEKGNLVGAINEIDLNIGSLASLTTNEQSSIVNAINEVNQYSSKLYPRYGIKIDKANSNPDTRIEYILDATGFTPARMNYTSGLFEYGSWADIWFVKDNYPCMVRPDGTEAYKLDPDNYALKEDGTASDVANSSFSGNAMSAIPTVWIKQYEDASYEYIILCERQYDFTYKAYAHTREDGSMMNKIYLSMFRGAEVGGVLRSISGLQPMHSNTAAQEITKAELNGNLWTTRTWAHRNLINSLLTVISKYDDSQIAFGNGNLNYTAVPPTNGVLLTGTENTGGQFKGYNDGTHQVKTFHIEAWWADQYDRIQGMLNVNGHILVKMTKPYNLIGNDFYDTGVTPTGNSGGYINLSVMQGLGRIPWTASGSSVTYQCDGLYFDNAITAVTLVGGYCSHGSLVGLSFVNVAYSATRAYWALGAAISCEPPLVV